MYSVNIIAHVYVLLLFAFHYNYVALVLIFKSDISDSYPKVMNAHFDIIN